MYESLKERAYKANMELHKYGIAPFTWGNASECDRENRVFAIKPSGVPYEELSADKMVIVSFDGEKVEGDYNPSSDTPTHAVLYRSFNKIGGIVHTHSEYAVSFAQAGIAIPALGTTHADFSFGEVSCARELTADEVNGEYEVNTGKVIVEHFKENNIDENAVPAVLVKSHGPFAWGKNASDAAKNGAILETVAKMALNTLMLSPDSPEIPQYLLEKHYMRKHGKNAYYGQGKNND